VRRVSRAPRAKALAVVLVVAVAGFTLAACGNPETEVEGCTGTSSEVVAAISTKLHKNVGNLRNTHQFSKGTGGVTFITAELHDPEKGEERDQRHDKGEHGHEGGPSAAQLRHPVHGTLDSVGVQVSQRKRDSRRLPPPRLTFLQIFPKCSIIKLAGNKR